MKKIFALLCLLIFSTSAVAQRKKDVAVIYFNNLSILHANIKFDLIEMDTPHGKLKIPTKDCYKIVCGYHCEETLFRNLQESLNNLANSSYKDRAAADKFLFDNYQYSYNLMLKFETKDTESIKRIVALCKKIRQDYNVNDFDREDFDTLYTTNGGIYKGKLIGEGLSFDAINVAKFTAKYYTFNSIIFCQNMRTTNVLIDSAKTYEDNEWIDTGVDVSGLFKLKAKGEVDNYPSEPGKYISNPTGLKGYMGKGGFFLSGTLIAKLGENGKEFSVGNIYNGNAIAPIRLYLRIVPSPWNQRSSGKYEVSIN